MRKILSPSPFTFPLPPSKLNLDNVTPKAILRLEQVNLFTKLKTQLSGNHQGYPILQNIAFEVFLRERIAIVGPSGGG